MSCYLLPASSEHQIALKNLMQFYIYDFSEFIDLDVGTDGLFEAYPYLEDYWNDKNRFPYLIKFENKYAGFVLVRKISSPERSYFSIAEFFILKKYRRGGIGKTIAFQVFDLHKGPWEVFQKETNKPAQLFWNKVIREYTKGQYQERVEEDKLLQSFEN